MTWHEATHQYQGHGIDLTLPKDSTLEAYLLPFRMQVEKAMNDTVATVARTLTLEKPESTLGNLLADLLLEEAARSSSQPIDLAILNYGGIRLDELPAGPMRLGMIYQIMPFDNQISILEIPGKGLQELMDRIAGQGGWPVSHTVRMHIQDEKAMAVLINRLPIQESRTYRVAMSDYLANGGDKLTFLRELPRQDTGVLVRDAILSYCRRQQGRNLPLYAILDGRIQSNL